MKYSLKSLTIISFLIFCLPFFKTCQATLEPEDLAKKTSILNSIKEIFSTKDVLNGYEFSIFTLNKIISKKKLPDEMLIYSMLAANLCILLTIIFSVFNVFFVFKEKYKIVFAFAIINIVLLFLSIGFIIGSGQLSEYTQIRIGYYLFLLNLIGIIILSKRIKPKLSVIKSQ